MKLLTDLFSHLFIYGLITAGTIFVIFMILGAFGYLGQILFSIFYPLYAITLKPIIWGIQTIFQTRCPECKGFFKKKNVNLEITEEHEVNRTVNRVDQGVLYSNNLFALNQGFEINRQEQATFVERIITKTWQCKNPYCGNQWQTEEFQEFEGSLNK
jgi:hypothetical protein